MIAVWSLQLVILTYAILLAVIMAGVALAVYERIKEGSVSCIAWVIIGIGLGEALFFTLMLFP